ncbi:hypothetical protein IVA80_15315 [Bradyrhizobium sp. 139]|uniref:hypothetical protein n=1 Tax=Bradyrhizobium sp. 139 TaxID=2782616 RepID=UPI001FFA270E|nr:hypothetical protein [Bradyrhizobium sp. 139]MCK1742193.1 hypothetical protein [Bradyrhizobium sp. 139]
MQIQTYECPACRSQAQLKYYVPTGNNAKLYYGCQYDRCRHHFLVVDMEGCKPEVVAESPLYGELEEAA